MPPRWLLWEVNAENSSQRCCWGGQEVGRWEKNEWKTEKKQQVWILTVKSFLWQSSKVSLQTKHQLMKRCTSCLPTRQPTITCPPSSGKNSRIVPARYRRRWGHRSQSKTKLNLSSWEPRLNSSFSRQLLQTRRTRGCRAGAEPLQNGARNLLLPQTVTWNSFWEVR